LYSAIGNVADAESSTAASDQVFAGCDADARKGGDLAARLYAQILLPELERHINNDAGYAELRQQLHCRLLAEWLRARNKDWRLAYEELRTSASAGRESGDMLEAVALGAYGELHPHLHTADESYSPRQTFDAYAHSYSSGEFNVTRYVQVGDYAYAKVFFYGAIDFRMGRHNRM